MLDHFKLFLLKSSATIVLAHCYIAMCAEGQYRFLCPGCWALQNTEDYFSACRFFEEDDDSCAMSATVWVGYIDQNCGALCDECEENEESV